MRFVIVLLGNKGEVYKDTRHNASRILFETVKEMPHGFDILTPTGFMNESGLDVAKYLRYHDEVMPIIVYDDKDLEIGRLMLAYDRGDGGHNGLKSVIQCLGRTDFLRLRVGIAKEGTDGQSLLPLHGDAVQKFVMGKMTEQEKAILKEKSKSIVPMLTTLFDHGYQKAMEVYNKKI